MSFENDELLQDFVTESSEHLESIEDDFLLLEEQKDNPDKELIGKVFRAIHSVKGAAGFFGLVSINDMAHVMETLLSMMREGEILPQSQYIDGLLEGVDALKNMRGNITLAADLLQTTVRKFAYKAKQCGVDYRDYR